MRAADSPLRSSQGTWIDTHPKTLRNRDAVVEPGDHVIMIGPGGLAVRRTRRIRVICRPLDDANKRGQLGRSGTDELNVVEVSSDFSRCGPVTYVDACFLVTIEDFSPGKPNALSA